MTAVVIRLAYFNITGVQSTGNKSYYTGLPVTYCALILPLVFIAGYYLTPEIFKLVLGAAFTALAFLYLLKIPVPKPGGIFYVVFPVLAVLLTFFPTHDGCS
jgi:CDP-diacylglycerol--serine O-phosphatidyltransferase